MGCVLSDLGLEEIYTEPYGANEIESIFDRARSGRELEPDQSRKLKSAFLYEFALMDHAQDWGQQFHLGALRNTNTHATQAIGPDSGYDSIGDFRTARPMAAFFDRLNNTDQLARTIIYNVNPSDNEVFASMTGNFQDGVTPGKIQFGSGWWHLDQLDGMTRQINALSNMGLLSRFIGMLTDSRSFLSYSRHDYFRRLLCNLIGSEIESGLVPAELEMTGRMIQDICFNNVRDYFRFDV
jgi:glucuronate isomerase